MLMLVAFLFWSVSLARRMRLAAHSSGDRALAAGLEASLVAIASASCFLSEAYYIPLWLVSASVVALARTHVHMTFRRSQRLIPA